MGTEVEDFLAARKAAPYGDEATVARLTEEVTRAGHSIFEIFRLAPDDLGHAREMLDLFSPPAGALVLDAGCGTGRVAEMMQTERPDLRFVLLNVSPAQLGYCDARNARIAADFHTMPFADRSFDAAMVNYALGHALLAVLMLELGRVLRPGGSLFIYDLAAEQSATLIARLGYKAHARARVIEEAAAQGLALDFARSPRGADAGAFKRAFGRRFFESTFAGISPIAYCFRKVAA